MTPDRSLELPEGLEGERLDAAMARLFGLSRSRAAALIEAGAVHLDGAVAMKSQRVSAGQWLDLQWPQEPEEIDDEPTMSGEPTAAHVPRILVLHADDDIIVIDKPVGIAAHPSPGWTGPTVTSQLTQAGYRVSTSGAPERQGIVHRLDVGTSGVMVVAAGEQAYSNLKDQFRQRTVDKVYHALVQGHPDPSSGTIDAPIDRHPSADHRFAVVSGGKPSITHYDTLEAFRHASLLEVHLETGRTHQIRVHMAAMRHPCVGDLTYGADPVLAERLGLRRQWLHAVSLTLTHPRSGERVTYTSDYPDDLASALTSITEWSQ